MEIEMLMDRRTLKIFREYRVEPSQALSTANEQRDRAHERSSRSAKLKGWAVHLAHDRTRIVVAEAWQETLNTRSEGELDEHAVLYEWAGTGGVEPTPVDDDSAGLIVIDIFAVWSALIGPVSAFNLKNGKAFNSHPGCVSTTVLRGRTRGRIATYARWRSIKDFLDAFQASAGGAVRSLEDINTFAARKTFGLIRPDYHSYDLYAAGGLK